MPNNRLTHRVETFGQGPDEITVGSSGGFFNVLPCHSRRTICDVLVDRAVEQDRILEDDTDSVPPGFGGKITDVCRSARSDFALRDSPEPSKVTLPEFGS